MPSRLLVRGCTDQEEGDFCFLMLTPFHGERRLRRKARLAGAIMVATVLAAAFQLMTIEMAALAGQPRWS